MSKTENKHCLRVRVSSEFQDKYGTKCGRSRQKALRQVSTTGQEARGKPTRRGCTEVTDGRQVCLAVSFCREAWNDHLVLPMSRVCCPPPHSSDAQPLTSV